MLTFKKNKINNKGWGFLGGFLYPFNHF